MKKMKLDIQLFGASVSLTASESAIDDTAISTNQTYINLAIRVQTTKPTWNGEKSAYYQVTTTSTNNGTQTGSKYYFSIGSSTGSGDKTFNVTLGPFDHNTDGSLENVEISVYVKITSSTNRTATKSVSMETIPRASVPTLSSSSVNIGSSVTIYTNRYSSNFTHTISYTFGNASGTIGSNVTESATWSTPSSLAYQIPNSTSGVGTITCITYDGTEEIGRNSINITLNVPSYRVPSASFNTPTEEGDTPASWGIFVKTKSKVGLSLTTSGSYGSTVQSYLIIGDGYTYTTNPMVSNYLTSSGTVNFTAIVTDSRGRTKSVTKSITVVNYSSPTINYAQIQRCLADGTIDSNGEYCYIMFGAGISSCNNKNKANAHYKIGYRLHNTGDYTYVTVGSNYDAYSSGGILYTDGIYSASRQGGTKVQFSNTNNYDIQFYVDDTFVPTGVTVTKLLDVGFDLLNFNASGLSMAIGKVSEASSNEEKLEVALDTYMNKAFQLKVNNQYMSIFDLIYPIGSIYISVNNTNPSTYYGGTWEQIKDKFLLCAGNTYSAGSTGGEATHTLTVDEMPSHLHDEYIDERGSKKPYCLADGGGNGTTSSGGVFFGGARSAYNGPNVGTAPIGGGQSHNNMPPYLAVYVWKRTA
ncbi:MAG: hypothetical protein IKD74_03605 [Clostridia bacterium]|nr:hypothetical protein [Clostridia bacterium]